MELIQITSELMPGGVPKYLEVVKYPMIRQLAEQMGRKKIILLITLMVKNLCSSVNVVRNMNEDQMIEAAAMLLDECGNFRLEDYQMMFTMAKRGNLVNILDRMDIQVIGKMMDEYWNRRNAVAETINSEEINHFETLGSLTRNIEQLHPSHAKMVKAVEGLAAGFSSLSKFKAEILSNEEAKKR